MMFPLVREIAYGDPIRDVLYMDKQHSRCVFLDSALFHPIWGRYSFIAVDPFESVVHRPQKSDTLYITDPWAPLAILLDRYTMPSVEGIPPFQGGICGFFSYDLCRDLEPIPSLTSDDGHPRYDVGLYDLVISFDHQEKRAWLVSSGFPHLEAHPRKDRALHRMNWLEKQLEEGRKKPISIHQHDCTPVKPHTLTSNFTPIRYRQAVEQLIEAIRCGEIFEANLAQRFHGILHPLQDPLTLYETLRRANPAPFAAYVKSSSSCIHVLSASPERFLAVRDGKVETKPIKGTRPRGRQPQEDQAMADELLNSRKDRAENTMIVDLMRNDLSRVCLPHSIEVPHYCELESYETVHHLVSTIRGQLDPKYNLVDLFKLTFPAGSVTGAPKVRAMQWIEQLEPHRRGPYCGSVGYLGFDGSLDTSVVIRSYILQNNQLTFHAGGAVVLDSDPEQEYEETLVKVRVLRDIVCGQR